LAIGTQVDVRSEPPSNFGLVAVSTAGSAKNLELLQGNEAQVAVVQQFAVEQFLDGHANGPEVGIASIGWLWRNVEHFLLLKEFVTDGTLGDVANVSEEPVYLGAQKSGVLQSTSHLLEAVGVSVSRKTVDVSSYDAAADALIEGKVVFASLPGGDPVSSVSRIMSVLGPSVRMLEVTDEEYGKIFEVSKLWRPFQIPPGTYAMQDRPVATLAQRNLLIVRKDLPEDDVYVITKEVFANVDELGKAHPALSQLNETRGDVSEIRPPLHPGARRYFEEVGILKPDDG
jgi:TRAP transporter TAXI family solute receptor